MAYNFLSYPDINFLRSLKPRCAVMTLERFFIGR